ncbi:MAG: hydrogenase nickel incorporation protein HypA [Candidatus Korarchaeota archaeon]|nr:hydrogenase nickel incorporation protein HypA [Candidatus Korarchaeota archaeon]
MAVGELRMHEWTLAEAIVESLNSLINQDDARKVLEVEILYGEMMELESDILNYAIEELARGTALEGAKFSLKEEKALFRCNACGATWDFETAHKMLSHEFGILEEPSGEKESPLHFIPDLAQALLKCPQCGSRDFETISGKGIRIARVVLER